MRVIAGKHRGARIAAPAGVPVRPTADRVREALFNILAHAGLGAGGGSAVEGARVLDAFAGSGALGIEALSRGAAAACFLDMDSESLKATRRNLDSLDETANATLVLGDATRPPAAPAACDLVLMDPPYKSGAAAPALAALAARGWIAPGALAMVELSARDESFAPPPGFEVLDERRYGAARLVFLRHEG